MAREGVSGDTRRQEAHRREAGRARVFPRRTLTIPRPGALSRSPVIDLQRRPRDAPQAGHRPHHGFLTSEDQRVDDVAPAPPLLLERGALPEHLAHVRDSHAPVVGELPSC